MSVLRSRDNPRVKRWAKLVRDGRSRKHEGRAVLEGPHVVQAALLAGIKPEAILVSEQGLQNREIAALPGKSATIVSESVFRSIVDAENPQGIAAEIAIPSSGKIAGTTVFLEGVQDPGNVGAIMRSAATFGAATVVLDRGCADPWAPKTLRAGMGAQFSLQIVTVPSLDRELGRFAGRVLAMVPRGGSDLQTADLSGQIGWLFGAEGQGLSEASAREADLRVTIPMAAGSESLNVAAAAAICLYESVSRRDARS